MISLMKASIFLNQWNIIAFWFCFKNIYTLWMIIIKIIYQLNRLRNFIFFIFYYIRRIFKILIFQSNKDESDAESDDNWFILQKK